MPGRGSFRRPEPPARTCAGCGDTDAEPKHVVLDGDAETAWHPACHVVADGCDICMTNRAS